MNLPGALGTARIPSLGWRALALALVTWAPSASAAWQLDCRSEPCRILGFADVLHESGPERIALEVTKQGDVVVTALCTRARHREFFDTKPRTFARLDGEDFVLDPSYFDDRLPASLDVDAVARWTLLKQNAAQFKASTRDTETILETLGRGDAATLTYAAAYWGEGQKVRISLVGFKQALESLGVERPKPVLAEASADPLSVVQRLIGRNEFGVAPEDLQSKPNTRGKGAFVYVSERRSQDAERDFLWFVNDGMAVNLTEATHELTPALKHPREASANFWSDTGLSEGTVRLEGLKTAFGD